MVIAAVGESIEEDTRRGICDATIDGEVVTGRGVEQNQFARRVVAIQVQGGGYVCAAIITEGGPLVSMQEPRPRTSSISCSSVVKKSKVFAAWVPER